MVRTHIRTSSKRKKCNGTMATFLFTRIEKYMQIDQTQRSKTSENEHPPCLMSLYPLIKIFRWKNLASFPNIKTPKNMWKCGKVMAISVVIGALGLIKRGTQKYFDEISRKPSLQEIERIVLTSSAHILRQMQCKRNSCLQNYYLKFIYN